MRCLFIIIIEYLTLFVPDISAERASAEWIRHKSDLVRCCKSEEEADRIIDLLRSMLVLDPAERPSVRQVIETHHWVASY